MKGRGEVEGNAEVVLELLDEVGAGESGSGGSSGGGGDGCCSSSSRLFSIKSNRDGRVLSRGLPRPNIRYCGRYGEEEIGRVMYNGEDRRWTRVILVVEFPPSCHPILSSSDRAIGVRD